MKRKLKEYHFSCGNSNTGSVGFCAVVRAYTKDEAVKKLRGVLRVHEEIVTDLPNHHDDIVYLNVYFNETRVVVRDIDETTEVEDACDAPLSPSTEPSPPKT